MAAWVLRPGGVTTGNDDALYLLLARSLRGFAYRDIHIVGAPGHGQYPPGYPALLALTGAVFGDGLGPLHLATILCSTVALFLTFDLTRRLAGTWPALGLLAALSVNHNLLEYASQFRSEPFYAALSLGALWAYLVMPGLRVRLWSVGGLAVLAGLTRSIGISLVVAVLIVFLLERRWKAAALFVLLGCGAMAVWVGWTVTAPAQFAARSYVATLAENRHFAQELVRRVAETAMAYAVRGPLAGLGVPTVPDTNLDNIIWMCLLWGLFALGAWALRRTHRLLALYLCAYFALLVVYPYRMTRFFMPIAPVYLLAVMVGLGEAARRRPRLALVAGALLVGGIAFSGSRQLIRSLQAQSSCESLRDPDWAICLSPRDQAFFRTVAFVERNLPADAAVLTPKEAPFAYYTGLHVLHPETFRAASSKDYLEKLERKGVEYVLLSPFPGGEFAARALLNECHHLEVIFSTEPRTSLLRIGADSLSAERSGSCAALAAGIRGGTPDAPDPFERSRPDQGE